MKPELSMNDLKDSIPQGPVVFTQMASTPEPRKRNTKKYLIIGGSVILVIAIVLAAILIGMFFFTKAQTDLIKHYTLNVDKKTKEDVTVDQDGNSVEYHYDNENYEMWVIDDYNKDIQTLKVKTSAGTNCYIGPLNRTALTDPRTINALQSLPSEANQNYTRRLNYDISGKPVSDSSFLGKKARDACKGISVYWIYPKCDTPGADGVQRTKRCYYYCVYYSYYCYGGSYICTRYICFRYC